ncbi:MAG: Mrp/NBP35 family ATP-binding protein [Planctomycetia bacterium]|nr:Mrp/NBP35 family ATP-binding protein [Planctomycetia bacterium]
MVEGPMTIDRVNRALAEFKEPETGRGIVQVKQVHDVKLDGNNVSVTLGLTTFSAPVWKTTRAELEEHLRRRLPEAQRIDVKLALHERPAEKMGEIGLAAKAVIAVGSGKGGVGKSTIAAILACGLARAGCNVGLLDADMYGPSIPHLLGSSERPRMIGDRIEPITIDGVKVMSMGLLVPPGEAVIWRGPMLHGAITQFLRDTEWGQPDYLIIDMPPGTGDVALSLSQLLPLSGAVVVCTPQEVALLDAAKAIAMFRKVNIHVVGMVENMSFFMCPDCGARHDVFGHGGARAKAAELHVPFLGEVPLNIALRIRGDEGRAGSSFDDQDSKPYLDALCRNLVETLVARRRAKPPMPDLPVIG